MMDALMQLETDRIDAQIITVSGESKHRIATGYKFIVQTPNGDYDYVATSVVHISMWQGTAKILLLPFQLRSKFLPIQIHTFRKADAQTAMKKITTLMVLDV
ncbi:MAG: hypothetical protein IPP29_16910 [Bacteroidetes bacterium]|nr:hypothetical protein [Bacteroidota bacterium]